MPNKFAPLIGEGLYKAKVLEATWFVIPKSERSMGSLTVEIISLINGCETEFKGWQTVARWSVGTTTLEYIAKSKNLPQHHGDDLSHLIGQILNIEVFHTPQLDSTTAVSAIVLRTAR